MVLTLEEDLDDNWDLQPRYHFKYAMQCRNPKVVLLMMKTFTEARESVSVLKLEPVNENDKDLEKDAFILTIELLVGEYGQQNLYFIGVGEKVVKFRENYHMVVLEYHLLGPLCIIAFLQKEHSDLLVEIKRPALSAIAKPSGKIFKWEWKSWP